MELRFLTLDDLPTYKHIASRAFRRGEPVEMKPDEFLPCDRVRLGAFDDGRLQAQYTILDVELFFGDLRRPCGAIASVACEPSARGRGYAGALIDRSLEVMRERGQYLSLLWPFDQRFYQRHGWDWAGYDRTYVVPLDLLGTDPEAEHIQPVFENLFEALNPVYEEMARRYNGAFVRTEKRWKDRLEPEDKREPATYIYRRDGRAEGYAVVRYEKKQERARVSDLAALTPRAYRALLTLFKRHASTVKQFRWYAPMDDPLWIHLAHWDIKTKIEPSAMGRIVDLEAALTALRPDHALAGDVRLAVTDAHAPWNQGTWRVTAEGGRVTCARSTDTPQAGADIRAVSQAYWGTPSLRELHAAGKVEVSDERAYRFLASLLPPTPVWLGDDF